MKKMLSISLLIGLTCIASRSWAMESEMMPASEELTIEQADARLAQLFRNHPDLEEQIKHFLNLHYISNFNTRSNRERLENQQQDLRYQKGSLGFKQQQEKLLYKKEILASEIKNLELKQEALALLAQIECTGEPEEELCVIL